MLRSTGDRSASRAATPSHRRHDHGSALLLVPAGFLVLVLLAAMAVDLAHVYGGQRQVAAIAEAAANDAVTLGLDIGRLRAGEGYHLDPSRVRIAVNRTVALQRLKGVRISAPIVEVLPGHRVRVTLTGTVDHVFGGGVPGVASAHVRATATATVR